MAHKSGKRMYKPVKSISIHGKQHPDEIASVNILAQVISKDFPIDVSSHAAIHLFFRQTASRWPEIIKYCREELNIAI